MSEVNESSRYGIKRLMYLWWIAQPPYSEDREWQKEDVADMFHWLRQLTCILLGICLGLLGVTGWIGFVIIISLLWGLSKYCLDVMRISDSIMSVSDTFQDGIVPALMSFTGMTPCSRLESSCEEKCYSSCQWKYSFFVHQKCVTRGKNESVSRRRRIKEKILLEIRPVVDRVDSSFQNSHVLYDLLLLICRELSIIFGLCNSVRLNSVCEVLDAQLDHSFWFMLWMLPIHCVLFFFRLVVWLLRALSMCNQHAVHSICEHSLTSDISEKNNSSQAGHSLFHESQQEEFCSSKNLSAGSTQLCDKTLSRNDIVHPETEFYSVCIDTLIWCEKISCIIIWGSIFDESSNQTVEGLALIPLRIMEESHVNLFSSESVTLGGKPSSGSRVFLCSPNGTKNLNAYTQGFPTCSDAAKLVYHVPEIPLFSQDILGISLCPSDHYLTIALAVRNGLRVWSAVYQNLDEELLSNCYSYETSDRPKYTNDSTFHFEEQGVIVPHHLQSCKVIGVTWLSAHGTLVALMSNLTLSALVVFDRSYITSKTLGDVIVMWRSSRIYDLSRCFLFPAFPYGLRTREVIAVSECPFRPLLACLSSAGDVILIDTLTWRSSHWSLCFSSDVKILPQIAWLPASTNITGFLCATEEALFQCILPPGQILKTSDFMIRVIPLHFSKALFSQMTQEKELKDSLACCITLKAFSLDHHTGTRLGVILREERTRVWCVMVFRYIPSVSRETLTWFEGTIQYDASVLHGKATERNHQDTVIPCSIQIGCPVEKKEDQMWIGVLWRVMRDDVMSSLEYHFYTFHETLLLRKE